MTMFEYLKFLNKLELLLLPILLPPSPPSTPPPSPPFPSHFTIRFWMLVLKLSSMPYTYSMSLVSTTPSAWAKHELEGEPVWFTLILGIFSTYILSLCVVRVLAAHGLPSNNVCLDFLQHSKLHLGPFLHISQTVSFSMLVCIISWCSAWSLFPL